MWVQLPQELSNKQLVRGALRLAAARPRFASKLSCRIRDKDSFFKFYHARADSDYSSPKLIGGWYSLILLVLVPLRVGFDCYRIGQSQPLPVC